MNDGRPTEGEGSPEDGGTSGSRPLTRRELRDAERAAQQQPPGAVPYADQSAAFVPPAADGVTDETVPIDTPVQPEPAALEPEDAAPQPYDWQTLLAAPATSSAPLPTDEAGVEALFGGLADEPATEGGARSATAATAAAVATVGVAASGGAGKPPRRPPSMTSRIIGVAGEVLITAGVVVLLFIGWRMWIEGIALNANQERDAAGLSDEWAASGPTTPVPSGTASPPTGAPTVNATMDGDPIVQTDSYTEGQKFAVLYVPRFGSDFKRTISEGVDPAAVLNAGGAGHYTETSMPGAMGNFAIAAHRDGWGSPFLKINELQVGDPIYVETQDGYYTYQYRGSEYVSPYGVGVLDPVPQVEGASPTDRIITLTSCNPLYIASERIAAYGVLVGWQPRSAGPPAAISSLVAAGQGN